MGLGWEHWGVGLGGGGGGGREGGMRMAGGGWGGAGGGALGGGGGGHEGGPDSCGYIMLHFAACMHSTPLFMSWYIILNGNFYHNTFKAACVQLAPHILFTPS